MANCNDMGFRIKFLMDTGRNLTHRDQNATLNPCLLVFPYLSYIQQDTPRFAAFRQQLLELMR